MPRKGIAMSDDMPDLYQADRHHPSVAGTYLAALTFYRAFTGRAGTDARYRPWGMSAADQAASSVPSRPTHTGGSPASSCSEKAGSRPASPS